MSRGLFGAAGVFIALGLVAVVALRRPERAEHAATQARPAVHLGPHDFDALEIRRGESRDGWTTMRRTPTEIRVVAPVDYPADPAVATAAFDAIAKLEFLDLVTDRPERQAGSQVDGAKGIRVMARKGALVVLDLVVGKAIADYGTLVRVGGRNEIWQVAGEIRETFERGPSDWRDRAVTTFRPEDVQRIEIAAADGARIVLRKTGTKTNFKHDDWTVVSSTVPIGRLDPVAPDQLVETMSSLKASTFADGATADAAGLAPPALTVTAVLAGWPSVTLQVGKAGGSDEVYVKNPEVPEIFLVKRFNIERVGRRPTQFREKTLCDISDAEVNAFSVDNGRDSYAVTKRDGAWIATRPAALNTAAIAPLANVFRAWTAPAIADELPPRTALSPRIVINGRSKTAACTIRVGAQTADQLGYFVTTAASKDVYVVPKWMVDRVAVRLDALAKNP